LSPKNFPVFPKTARECAKEMQEISKKFQRDKIAICLDNTGIENQFDQDIEYIFKDIENGIITVYDKIGKLQSCFEDRFKIISCKQSILETTKI
jgi:hypothetical protein